MVFFVLFVCPSRPLNLLINQWDLLEESLFPDSTNSSSFLNLFVVLNVNAQIQNIQDQKTLSQTPQQSWTPLPPQKKKFTTFNRLYCLQKSEKGVSFVGIRKKQAPTSYENHRLCHIFQTAYFIYETVGLPLKLLHYRMSNTIPKTTLIKSRTVKLEIRLDWLKKTARWPTH